MFSAWRFLTGLTKGVAVIAVAAGLIMFMSYWAAGRAKPMLDAAAREKLIRDDIAHAFIDLPDGTVHYQMTGPESGPVIVLIHGFSVPSFVWNDYVKPLNEAGYRVLAYDNFGRGFSDRPETRYDAALMDRQLADLLSALGIDRRVDLVGYSMGGAIATIFAARHPELVRSLSLIAPAGLGIAEVKGSNLIKRPVIGDWIIRLFGLRIFHDAAASEARLAPDPSQFLSDFDRQLEWRGYGDALLSTMRHYPLASAESAFQRAGSSTRPVLVVWGEDDAIVPYINAARLIELMPRAKLHSYPGIGHDIAFSHAPMVSGLIVSFLEAQSRPLTSGGPGGKPRGPLSRLEPRECEGCASPKTYEPLAPRAARTR